MVGTMVRRLPIIGHSSRGRAGPALVRAGGRASCRRAPRTTPGAAPPTIGGASSSVSAMSDPAHNSHDSFAELDALPTAELQDRAFHRARERRDVGFFVSLFEHLPTNETGEDGSFGLQSTVDDA